uniref:Uncharacterized protein n=1 Tax=Arundo donax TaxID=35708 RepID=A0A0A9C0T9_ARUDO
MFFTQPLVIFCR